LYRLNNKYLGFRLFRITKTSWVLIRNNDHEIRSN
jgi:hypothetical protein